MDFLDPQVLKGVVPPALTAGVVLGVSHLRQLSADHPVRRLGLAVAIGFGFAAGQQALIGWPELVPKQAVPWCFHLALIGVLRVALSAAPRLTETMLVLTRFVVVPFAVHRLIGFMIEYHWQGREAWMYPAGLAAAGIAILSLADLGARRAPGFGLPAILSVACALAGQMFFLYHSALLAQLSGALACVFGACAALAVWRRDVSLGKGVIETGWLVFCSLLLYGRFGLDDLPTRPLLVFATLPVLGLMMRVRYFAGRNYWLRNLALFAFGVAVALAAFREAEAARPVSEYDSYLYR